MNVPVAGPNDNSHVTDLQVYVQPNERRSTGVMWYVNTLGSILWQGFGEVRNNELVERNIRQVGVGASQLTTTVSEVAGQYISNIRSSMNPSECFRLLDRTQVQEIFGPDAKGSYLENLLRYRGITLDSAKKDTAVRIFRGLGLSFADRVLRPYLPDGFGKPLSALFKADREAIKKITPQVGQGLVPWIWNKAVGGIRFFDPLKDGNFPFLIGTRKIAGNEVNVLRHPLPTAEWGTITIAPEYKAFLEYLKDQKTGVLYDCLLQLPGQLSLSSGPRIELLYKLGEAYPDVFYFVRMPFDGPLIKVDNVTTLADYKDRVKTEIYRAINFSRDQSNEFIFGSTKISNAVNAHYEKIIDFAFNQISNVYRVSIEDDVEMNILPPEKEQKQVFMMLVQTLLRSVLIKELDVGYYGNTCKHSSDRGAAATGCDLIWSHFLTDTLKDHLMDLRLTTACPAFVGKSSAVEEARAEPLDAFARFVEAAYSQGKREQILGAYTALEFPVEESMSYYRPKIYYPQVGAEIHRSIEGQDAERGFSIDIEYDFSKPQSELLDKLLEIFENQYSLTFVRIGDEGVVPKGNLDEEKADYYIAEGRFAVNDMHGDTYGELTFTLSFKSPDEGSKVLEATIKSKLEAVVPQRSDLGFGDDTRPLDE